MFALSRSQQRGLMVLSFLIVGGMFLPRWWPDTPLTPHRKLRTGPDNRLVVELSRGVRCPGLYSYNRPTPLVQVIAEAGGLTASQVLPSALHQEILDRDIQISLVSASGAASPIEKRPLSVRALIILGRPIPLNQATAEELDRLPGIGPGLALRLVEHRNNRGPFSHMEEMRQVRGIGDKTLERLRPWLTVP